MYHSIPYHLNLQKHHHWYPQNLAHQSAIKRYRLCFHKGHFTILSLLVFCKILIKYITFCRFVFGNTSMSSLISTEQNWMRNCISHYKTNKCLVFDLLTYLFIFLFFFFFSAFLKAAEPLQCNIVTW